MFETVVDGQLKLTPTALRLLGEGRLRYIRQPIYDRYGMVVDEVFMGLEPVDEAAAAELEAGGVK